MLLVQVAILSLLHPQQITINDVTVIRRGAQIESVGRLRDILTFRGEIRIRMAPGFQRTYHGELQVTSSKNELQLILQADLEYLTAATVSAESPPNAPPEALKAQAIVARSWIQASKRRHGQFDICDTTHCQHFKEPTPSGGAAALATKGLILAWQGKPFAPAYSASCGGRTKTAAAIGWADQDTYPYFAVDCPVCQRAEPEWLRRFDGADAIAIRANPHAESTRLSIGRRSGWAALPSNNFEFIETPEGLQLKGRGQGHGLGYCQRGGAGLAKSLSAAAILHHYFPGTAIISSR